MSFTKFRWAHHDQVKKNAHLGSYTGQYTLRCQTLNHHLYTMFFILQEKDLAVEFLKAIHQTIVCVTKFIC